MSIRIPARFNGPQESANGGYTCGLVAEAVGAGGVEVSLRAPPPLDEDLDVDREDDGGVTVRAGDTVVATGRPASVEVGDAPAVSVAEARAASEAGFGTWTGAHPFPRCFVCGPDRAEGDGYRIFPGRLGGDGAFACTWTPAEEFAGADGAVAPEFVWAALDCPTSAPVATFLEGGPAIVLARLAAEVDAPVLPGEEHVLVSWPLAVDGRKRHSAVVLTDSGGRRLAHAEALWIQVRER